VASVVIVPLLSCLLGGWITATMEFGQTVEVLAVILSIVLFSVALLGAMNVLFEISYFSELGIRSNILKVSESACLVLSVINIDQITLSKMHNVYFSVSPSLTFCGL